MKTTPWFLGSVKPVRAGVYERKYRSGIGFCKWNGMYWFCFDESVAAAKRMRATSAAQALPWRGILKA